MLVILRPVGRGRWHTCTLLVSGRRAPLPVEFHREQRVQLGGQTFRVVAIRPSEERA